MFMLYISLCIMVPALMCLGRYFWLEKKGKETDYASGATFLAFIAVIIFVISLAMSMASVSQQIADIESLKKYDQLEAIYEKKSEELTARFAKLLVEIYPEYEKNIFDKISPDKVDIYLVKYPELQASQTLTAQVEKIHKLENDRYDQRIAKAELLNTMRYRLKSPWIFHSWVAPIPAKYLTEPESE